VAGRISFLWFSLHKTIALIKCCIKRKKYHLKRSFHLNHLSSSRVTLVRFAAAFRLAAGYRFTRGYRQIYAIFNVWAASQFRLTLVNPFGWNSFEAAQMPKEITTHGTIADCHKIILIF